VERERERQIALLGRVAIRPLVVGFSRNGKLLAAIAAGKGLKLWTLETLKRLRLCQITGNAFMSTRSVFTIKGEAVAVGNMDGTVEVLGSTPKGARGQLDSPQREGSTGGFHA